MALRFAIGPVVVHLLLKWSLLVQKLRKLDYTYTCAIKYNKVQRKNKDGMPATADVEA